MKKIGNFLPHSKQEILKMKNKKADFTLEETMKIILAVVSIGLLLYLATSLYGLFNTKTDVQQARATMEKLVQKINELEEGKIESFLLESPKNWLLTTKNDKLCICPRKLGTGNRYFSVCENGVCDKTLTEKIYNSNTLYLGIVIDIKEIYISKSHGVIVIEEKKGSYAETQSLFEEVLSFKGEKESVEELIIKYINTKDKNVKTELNTLLKKFFAEKKIYGIFYVTDVASGKTADIYVYSELPTNQDLSKGTPQTKNIQGEDKKTYQLFFNAIKK